MDDKIYGCRSVCRNGNEGCGIDDFTDCVRFMPLVNTNLTEIKVTVETPPEIDSNKLSQYFINWVEAMGWNLCGTISPYKDND